MVKETLQKVRSRCAVLPYHVGVGHGTMVEARILHLVVHVVESIRTG